jgi:hypothetical protein
MLPTFLSSCKHDCESNETKRSNDALTRYILTMLYCFELQRGPSVFWSFFV